MAQRKKRDEEYFNKVRVVTPIARLSYPKLFKPVAYKNKEGAAKSYSAEFLLDKKTTDVKKINAALQYALVSEFGSNKANWPKPLRLPIRDGDKPFGPNQEVKPEHEGMWVISASTGEAKPPRIVDQKKKTLTDASKLYPGCYVVAVLSAGAYSEPKKGIKFYLNGVQLAKDGPALGGANVDDAFGIIEDDGDDMGDFADDDNDSNSFGADDSDEDEMTF